MFPRASLEKYLSLVLFNAGIGPIQDCWTQEKERIQGLSVVSLGEGSMLCDGQSLQGPLTVPASVSDLMVSSPF